MGGVEACGASSGGGRPWRGLCELGRRGVVMRCRGDHFPRPEGTVRCWGEARGGARARWPVGDGSSTARHDGMATVPVSPRVAAINATNGELLVPIWLLGRSVGRLGAMWRKESKNHRLNPRIDLGFIAVGEEQGWCRPPVRPNASMDFKFEFLNLVSTTDFI